METDTDSFILAIARPKIDECVRLEKNTKLVEKQDTFFASDMDKSIIFDGQK